MQTIKTDLVKMDLTLSRGIPYDSFLVSPNLDLFDFKGFIVDTNNVKLCEFAFIKNDNTMNLHIDKEDFINLIDGEYLYDIWIIRKLNKKARKFMEGKIYMKTPRTSFISEEV